MPTSSRGVPLALMSAIRRIACNSQKTKSTAWIAGVAFFSTAPLCQMAQAAALCPPQDEVIVTVTGKVTSGTDIAGIFGEPKSNLAGKSYLLIYTIDCGAGSQPQPIGNPPYFSQIVATATSYPVSATLTIDGVTVSSGFAPSSFAERDTSAPHAGGTASLEAWSAKVGEMTAQTHVNFSNPPSVLNYDWASPLSYYPSVSNPSTSSFALYTPEGLSGANGRLSVVSFVVSGPVLYTH